ncbi:hypothetical protein ACGC1H_001110 [Rhizoctonia solani]
MTIKGMVPIVQNLTPTLLPTKMSFFYGYPCTERNLQYTAQYLSCPYAGCKNAAAKLTSELQERFARLGPFWLVTARLNGEFGYVFALGMENCEEAELPLPLLEEMEKTFEGGPSELKARSGARFLLGSLAMRERFIRRANICSNCPY